MIFQEAALPYKGQVQKYRQFTSTKTYLDTQRVGEPAGEYYSADTADMSPKEHICFSYMN